MASTAANLQADEVKAKLFSWFQRFGMLPHVEIEARVREVDQDKFEEYLAILRRGKRWTRREEDVFTVDIIHESGVRETRPPQGPPTYMLKEKKDIFDVLGTDAHHPVRLSVSEERPVHRDESAVSVVRYKNRHTFEHKSLFKFELTEIKQGPSMEMAENEDSEYEIEIEYCGQAQCKQEQGWIMYLVSSFICKIGDAAKVSEQTIAEATGATKRPRRDGALAMGDVVALAPGTSVHLEPRVDDVAPEAKGVLPADQALQVSWVYSGRERGANRVRGPLHGAQPEPSPCRGLGATDQEVLAHVMSLPSSIGDRCYPLFHFTGHVPLSTVARTGAYFGL